MTTEILNEKMARDVFPAEVLMPDGTVITGARVFATSHRVLVYTVDDKRNINLEVELHLASPGAIPASRSDLAPNGRLEVRTENGTAWVNRGRGCGCGSVLKALGSPISWTAL